MSGLVKHVRWAYLLHLIIVIRLSFILRLILILMQKHILILYIWISLVNLILVYRILVLRIDIASLIKFLELKGLEVIVIDCIGYLIGWNHACTKQASIDVVLGYVGWRQVAMPLIWLIDRLIELTLPLLGLILMIIIIRLTEKIYLL